MSNPSDQGPLAPRRTLSKPKPGPGQDEAGQTPSSGSAVSNGASQGRPIPAGPSKNAEGQPTPTRDSRQERQSGGSSHAGPGRPSQFQSGTTEAPSNGQSSALPTYVPGGGSSTGPSSGPSGNPSGMYATVDLPTEHHMPVVPPMAPTPTPDPAEQNKQKEKAQKAAARAAARAARRAEATKPRTVRRAKLRLVRLDPWSVTKAAFLLSIAFGVMCVVAVFLVFSIMSASGLWDSVNQTVQDVVNQPAQDAFDINDYVGMSRVMGITMLISAIDVVILTALATLGAFIYNMAASLLGGVEITLAEDVR
jgi:hypothetical protein